MRSRVLKRILYGTIMIVVLSALLALDWGLECHLRERKYEMIHSSPLYGLPLAVIVLALALAAYRELSRLARAAGVRLLSVTGVLCTLGVATFPYWWRMVDARLHIGNPFYKLPTLCLLGLVVLAVLGEQVVRRRVDDAFHRVSGTLLAVLYLGVGGALILRVRFVGQVPTLVLFVAAVKCADIGAYFTGLAIGRHKMIPWLSPGKSWEGLVGGLAAAAGVSMLIVRVLDMEALAPFMEGMAPAIAEMTLGEAAVFGLAVGLAGQFGDLCESLLKRSAQVKDSGSLVPEFGGVLDILDSLLLAAPVALVLLAVLT